MSNGSMQKLSLFALSAMVVGGMVGSGIFSLPRTFDNATGPRACAKRSEQNNEE